jgi:hypothetical protein
MLVNCADRTHVPRILFRKKSVEVTLVVILFGLAIPAVEGAESGAESPASFVASGLIDLEEVKLWTTSNIDAATLSNGAPGTAHGAGAPMRLGQSIAAGLSPDTHGEWEDLPGGMRIWRLRLRSPGALWMVLHFDRFSLKDGARLYAYDPRRATVLGPYGFGDDRRRGQLWLPPIDGEEVVLELVWPHHLRSETPALRLGKIAHGFRPWGNLGRGASSHPDSLATTDAGDAGWCNIDINCPWGAEWQTVKRGVVMLLIGGVMGCTGSLVSNTDGDCRPLVLTANHCLSTSPEAASTTFAFNYERPACDDGVPSTSQTLTGSSLVATYDSSDFTLLELDQPPPQDFDAYFVGWSRSPDPPAESRTIHHPKGDTKKISEDLEPAVVSPQSPSKWRVTNWELGTTEPGSSGSPLLDTAARIRGALSQGIAACDNLNGYDDFGRLDASWTGGGTSSTRLSDWLDPLANGVEALDGLDARDCVEPSPRLTVVGSVIDDATHDGDGVAEPGETVRLAIQLNNDGAIPATEPGGELSTTSPLIEITGPVAVWGTLEPGATEFSAEPHFGLRLDPSFVCGDALAFTLDLSSSEGHWLAEFELVAGAEQGHLLFLDDMEAGPDGWTVATPVGSVPWVQTTARSDSPIHSWFADNVNSIADSVLTAPSTAPLPDRSRLRFRHFMNSELGFDGGILEYSTDGTNWADIRPLIVRGDYNERISTFYSSPLAGRWAWTGSSGVWRDVEIDLSSLAGLSADLRWRFASDSSIGVEGWYVDDVVVESSSFDCSTVPRCVSDTECDDHVPCTVDLCDEVLGVCSNSPPAVPDEIAGLRLARAETDPMIAALYWIANPEATSYNLYRSQQRDLDDLACCAPNLSEPFTTDDLEIQAGGLVYYLVSAENCAGESPL